MPGSLRARRRRPRPGAQLPVSTSARRTIQLTVSIAGTLRPSRVWAEITAENRVVELRSSAFGSAGRQAMRRIRRRRRRQARRGPVSAHEKRLLHDSLLSIAEAW